MKGSVRQRSPGIWRMRWDIPHPDGSGRRKQVSITVKGNKKEAEAALTKKLADVQENGYTAPSKETVAAYFRRWLKEHYATGKIRPRSRQGYQDNIERYIVPLIGSYHMYGLNPLKASHIQRMYTKLSEERKLSGRTILHLHRVVAMGLNAARRKGDIKVNPIHEVDRPWAKEKELTIWDVGQVNHFFEKAVESRYLDFYQLAFLTGMRRSELAGLKWAKVDLVNKFIRVTNTLQWIRGQGLQEGLPKTPQSTRAIELWEQATNLLHKIKGYRMEVKLRFQSQIRDELRKAVELGLRDGFTSDEELEDEVEAAFKQTWSENDYVFIQESGKPINPNEVSREFKCIADTTNLPVMTLHGLRHSHASDLLLRKIPAKVVSMRLGHASVKITLDTYSHIVPELQTEAAMAIEEGVKLQLGEYVTKR